MALRLALARRFARVCPLFGAHVIAGRVYSWELAWVDQREITTRALTGSRVKIPAWDEYGYHFALLGCYDWKLWSIAHTVCQAGDTIVEIGANIGTETVGFSDLVGPDGSVRAFEPVPENVRRLRENCLVGGLVNVSVDPRAVSDEAGTLRFVFPRDRNSGLGHIDFGDGWRPGQAFTVEATTLDEELNGRGARLLVMDVEGAEPRVLRGGSRWIDDHRPVIVVEAHHNRAEMHAFFEAHEYTVHSIVRLGLEAPSLDKGIPQYNWLAIHESEPQLATSVHRALRLHGLTPPIRGVHPLSRPPRPGVNTIAPG